MRILRLVVALVFLATGVACGEAPSSPDADAPLPDDPQRIVSALPGITEMVAYLGAADRLVGVSRHCDFPPEVRELPRISVLPLSLEALAELEPDLVVVDGTLMASSLGDLRRHFPAVLVLESRTLADTVESMERLARTLATTEALDRAAAFRRDLEAAIAAAAPVAPEASLAVLLVSQPDPLFALGPGALLHDMVRTCGCRNVAEDIGRSSGPFAEELVIERMPDWVLTTGPPLTDAIRTRWRGVPAVRDGRVASANADDLVRAGPRTPQALRRLAAVLRGRRPPADLEETP